MLHSKLKCREPVSLDRVATQVRADSPDTVLQVRENVSSDTVTIKMVSVDILPPGAWTDPDEAQKLVTRTIAQFCA